MTGEQTIFRAHRTERDRWTPVLNETIRDQRLSFRATGLLIYLLSLPPDWKANQQHIATCKTEGRDAVVTAWNELRQFGYLTKELVRDHGKIIATVWNVYETSQLFDRPTEKPETVQPEAASPETEIPVLRRTKGNKQQTNIHSADAETLAICFGEFWEAYPRKTAKAAAEKSFRKKGVFDNIEAILIALEEHKKTDQWKRGIVPHPATWLNQKRWNDDLTHEEKRRIADNSASSARGPEKRGGEAAQSAASQYAGIG